MENVINYWRVGNLFYRKQYVSSGVPHLGVRFTIFFKCINAHKIISPNQLQQYIFLLLK